MSDNWPTAFIEITVNNGLLPPGEDQSRNLEMAIKQLVPHLHEVSACIHIESIIYFRP